MMEKRWGRIINLTSVSVKQPIEGLILSNTIRIGVVGLAKTLSSEFAPYNITVNNVCPAYTMTERVQKFAADIAEKKRYHGRGHHSRMGIPDRHAAALENPRKLPPLSPSSHPNGPDLSPVTTIQIDGGWYKGVM